jgi:hypothetical protein
VSIRATLQKFKIFIFFWTHNPKLLLPGSQFFAIFSKFPLFLLSYMHFSSFFFKPTPDSVQFLWTWPLVFTLIVDELSLHFSRLFYLFLSYLCGFRLLPHLPILLHQGSYIMPWILWIRSWCNAQLSYYVTELASPSVCLKEAIKMFAYLKNFNWNVRSNSVPSASEPSRLSSHRLRAFAFLFP